VTTRKRKDACGPPEESGQVLRR